MEPQDAAPACMLVESPPEQRDVRFDATAVASETEKLEFGDHGDLPPGPPEPVLLREELLAPRTDADASASVGDGHAPGQLLKMTIQPGSPSTAAGDRMETRSDCSTADSTEASPHRVAQQRRAAEAAPPRTPLNPQVAAFVPGALAHGAQPGSSFEPHAGASALLSGMGGAEAELPWYEVLLQSYLGTSVLPTIGSKDHMLGVCKPCAFVHREEGCKSGVQCKFCHLCEPGVRKQRKKAKQQTARALRQQWGYQLPLL